MIPADPATKPIEDYAYLPCAMKDTWYVVAVSLPLQCRKFADLFDKAR